MDYYNNTMRELLDKTCAKVDGSVPYYDEALCWRTTRVLSASWISDCTAIQNCMKPVTDWINNVLANYWSRINNIENTLNPMIPLVHSHANYAVLNNIESSWSGLKYLWDDWAYHFLPSVSWYNQIQTNWVNLNRRTILNFWPAFTVTDDWTTTNVNIWCCGSWTWGTVTPFTCADVANCPSVLAMQLAITNLQTALSTVVDEKVKASASDTTTGYLDAKVKNSIEVNANQLQLVWDTLAPWSNMKYWTNSTGTKWWYPDWWSAEISQSVLFQNSVTRVHNLWKHPVVLCVDTNWYLVTPWNVRYTDLNTVVIDFVPVFTWTLYCS